MNTSINKHSKTIKPESSIKKKSLPLKDEANVAYKLGSVDGMWDAVQAAIKAVKYHQRSGVSRPAIVKYICELKKAPIDMRTRGVLIKVLQHKVKEGALLQSGQTFRFNKKDDQIQSETRSKPSQAPKNVSSSSKQIGPKKVAISAESKPKTQAANGRKNSVTFAQKPPTKKPGKATSDARPAAKRKRSSPAPLKKPASGSTGGTAKRAKTTSQNAKVNNKPNMEKMKKSNPSIKGKEPPKKGSSTMKTKA